MTSRNLLFYCFTFVYINPDMTFDLRISVLIKAEYKYYARASDREPQRRRAKI